MPYRLPEANRIEFIFPLKPWRIRIDRVVEVANDGLNTQRRRALRVKPLVLGQVDDGWPEIESLDEADDELQQLRRWLDRLVRAEKATPQLKKQIVEQLRGIPFHGILMDFDLRGNLPAHAIVGGVSFSSLSRWYSMALLVLVQNGLDGHVRRCELDSCRRYFIDWPKVKRGAPRKRFCEPNHAAMIRNRNLRERKRKARDQRRWSQLL